MAFSCNASGNPSPKFSWTKNGSPINITDNARISLSAGNKQLNITSVNRVDSGEYRCVANNSVGAVNSSAAFLTVQCKNTFTHLLAPNCVLVRVYHAARFSFQSGAPNDNFRKNICSEDDFRSRIFGKFVVKFLACLPLL